MGVCIEFENRAIMSLSNCWSIAKKVKDKKNNCMMWQPYWYYSSFESAMVALYEMDMRSCDARTVLELREASIKAASRILDACAPLKFSNAAIAATEALRAKNS